MSQPLVFVEEELSLFCAASHDRNPLHRSASYARKSVFGEPVVYGVLGAVAALGRLRERPGKSLRSLGASFHDAITVGIEYQLDVDDREDDATLTLRDGRRTLVHLEVGFQPGEPAPVTPAAIAPPREEAADRGPAELVAGLSMSGCYAPAPAALGALMARYDLARRGVGPTDLGLVCLASFLVGMELPGRRALFSRLRLERVVGSAAAIEYQARLSEYDERFELVRSEVQLSAGGRPLGMLRLESFVRGDVPPPATPARSQAWAGKVALITGASRGLGAALAQTLAWQGCTVLTNYLKSRAEVEALAERTAAAPGKVLPVEGDAADLGACGRIRGRLLDEGRGLDLLVCNASPPIRSLWVDAESSQRIERHVADSIRLVNAPLCTFLPLLAERAGQLVVISSSFVNTLPADFPHYVSAKFAAEGLVRVAAKEYPKVSVLIARPPKLLTDLSNTPMARQRALSAGDAAEKIVARLSAPRAGSVEVLEEFG
jgi:NAD(P)-dependent dehydrogenase (short-subunit alcohol dehydrogenase family)